MKLEFELLVSDSEESSLISGFLKVLVSNLKKDLLQSMNTEKIESMEEPLLNSKWVNWTQNLSDTVNNTPKHPKKIDMIKLAEEIINSIHVKQKENYRFVVETDRSKKMSKSRTPLEQVARFLDKGNDVYPGTHFLNNVFMKYRLSIDRFWKSYVSKKLKTYDSGSSVVVIR